MPHIIEVVCNSASEACSFLDGLVFSDWVSAVGHRPDGNKTRAVAVNWNADNETELDEQISKMIIASPETSVELDEVGVYCQIYPQTVLYQPEPTNFI